MKKKSHIIYPSLWDDLPETEKIDWLGKSVFEPQEELLPNQKYWEKGILLFQSEPKIGYLETTVFSVCSLGLTTNKENYDFDADKVLQKIATLDKLAQEEKQKLISQPLLIEVDLSEKLAVERQKEKVKTIMVRPFVKKYGYYDDLPYLQLYQNQRFFPLDKELENKVIVVSNGNRAMPFYAFVSDGLVASDSWEKRYCMALYLYDNEGNKEINISDEALDIFRKNYKNLRPKLEKKDIFNYVYGVLNARIYQQKYASFLENETPRIPFYADFWKWASLGRRLMALHLDYQKIEPFLLERIDKIIPEIEKDLSELTGLPEEFDLPIPKTRLRFSKEKASIEIDTQTTLSNIPPEVEQFLIGNKIALEFVLEAFKENKNHENSHFSAIAPYRLADYKEKLVALIGQIVATSLEIAELMK